MWSHSASDALPASSLAEENSSRGDDIINNGAYSASQPARAIPCSPERLVFLPALLPPPSSTSTSQVAAAASAYAGDVGSRRRMRCNAQRLEAAQRAAHPHAAQDTDSSTARTAAAAAPFALRQAKTVPVASARAASHKATAAANAVSSASPSSVLLRRTFHGTTRVLFADGHVETFTAPGAASTSTSIAAASSLPSLAHASSSAASSVNRGTRQRQGRKGARPTGAAAEAAGATNAVSISSCNHALSRAPTLPAVNEAPRSIHGKDASPVVLASYARAEQVYYPPRNDHDDNRHLSSAAHFQQTLPPSRASTEAAWAPPAATTTAKVELYEKETLSNALARLGGSQTMQKPPQQQQQQLLAREGAGAKSVRRNEGGGNTFFLTSAPTDAQPRPLEDGASANAAMRPGVPSLTSPDFLVFLCQMQQELRSELAKDQRTRAETFAHRYERSAHDSPSIFSLLFPFRPLEEIYRESAQLSAASFVPADAPRSSPRSPKGATNGAAPGTVAGGGVPDVLLPAAQVTSLMGWTVPELIRERLLPREAPALQHRLRELLALRGILDAPGTMACRFCVAFVWFVLLRCCKAHREQTLVDGHRRLSKAFADVFPLSARDAVPPLDVLGQLLVELLMCTRYADARAEENHNLQKKQQQQQQDDPPPQQQREQLTPPLPSPVHEQPNEEDDAAAAPDGRNATVHRDGPYYANVSDLLQQKDFFPLLTGEWAYLLRHAQTAATAAAAAAAASAAASVSSLTPSFVSLSHYTPHSLMDLPTAEHAQRKLSILPSNKALQTLLTVYQELWLLHRKYVENCLYEEQLYKQLAVLFRNVCVQVARATAGPATSDSSNSSATPKQHSSKATRVPGAVADAVDDAEPLSSHISINLTQLTSSGHLAVASASSPAAKDSILDNLLIVVAHATYFTCVFCFPNDVYAGVFDEEFRTDVMQWLSYCCHGVVTTHVQTKHWPMPVQADYEAVQELRSAAERRELAALGLHDGTPTPSSAPSLSSEEKDASTPSAFTFSGGSPLAEETVSVGRRTRGGGGKHWPNFTAEAEQKKPVAIAASSPASPLPMPTVVATTPVAAPATSPKRVHPTGGSASFTPEGMREESLDLENVVANAEFRLAHQLDRYSRAAAQHVAELERRMARLQRRHRLANVNSGAQRRPQRRGSHVGRRGSCYGGFSRANLSNAAPDLDEDDMLGASVHSLSIAASRFTSFRRPTAQPNTIAAKASFAPCKRPKSSTPKNDSNSSNMAPSFPVFDTAAAMMPFIALDVESTVCSSPLSAAVAATPQNEKRTKRKPDSIFGSACNNNNNSNNNNSNVGNGVAWRGTDAEQRTPLTSHPPAESPFSNRQPSTASKATSGPAGVSNNGANTAGGGNTQTRTGGDPRDLYRTSAVVKGDKSLVALASELNHGVLQPTTSTYSMSKPPTDAGHESTKTAEHVSSTSRSKTGGGGGQDGVNSSSDNNDAGGGSSSDPPQVYRPPPTTTTSTSAASLLSSYPLCTCPAPITEYWLAMSLRVSSWWYPATAAASRNATPFSLYASPAAAALQDGDDLAQGRTPDNADGLEGEDEEGQSHPPPPPPPLHVLAHEPWRGLYGRVVAVPPISGAAQLAIKLVDILADSLPHQQSLVYQAVREQERRQEQHRVDVALEVLEWNTTNDGAARSSQLSQQQRNELVDVPSELVMRPTTALFPSTPSNRMATRAAAEEAATTAETAAVLLSQPCLGTATLPVIPPVTSGQESLSIASRSAVSQSVAAYLRRRGVGETYQGCTSPFFQLYASTCLALTLSREEVVLLRESLNVARDKRRDKASLTSGDGLGGENGDRRKRRSIITTSNSLLPSQDIHGQQVLSSLLPLVPPSRLAGPRTRSAEAATRTAVATTVARLASACRRGTSAGTRKPPREFAAPASGTNAFAITVIPREEAKLRPRRMRPLQDEALRRRMKLLAEMELIGRRDAAARQNYVGQQLRLANVMAHLKTDTMLRRYRVRGRMALERLAVEDLEGGDHDKSNKNNNASREMDEWRDDEAFPVT
ncbi:hypothetical protein ABB37_09044 [Leptomonas pyrrhocoris]|uniref:Uncharacterized protein n=1 Tax=Leptomonas pyrrhocoris TaxID=157538 RepID=A0A0N0VD76_LEPPY|nr:hypothetical protein ABB37_09044 [Leptomonas pyrrhocoris]XP_015653184.1 hypothetical protein ABB37_09044 [Leptomonas pyrrhocoris]XP_015653185.1 hypothetical protein ABB37_09044 [Leptomonas pyrrhocoris]KPA74744.1 hypothetical protein ABB37_09044 [Leptomonas pyrrhocoris]KPA74745.1 hypothetical protein ABB37_09044 [Leptomonas pyrrhocoris]KPA74746.1 hypothetical protein ABB37_09044 [Leptomonas pyrrhocoris]|eukprot:XP_015653183.1 hypothetical protein ABB37_09044 [Leptomonas pyrrhocoris]